MEIAMLVIGIILLVFAVFLVVAVLMQQGKSHNLSGAIAGGAETFFGKSKSQTINKKLSIITTVVAIIFVLLVCSVTIMQDSGKSLDDYGSFWELINPFSDDAEVKDDGESNAVEHDHDGDGKADHTAEEHEAAVEHDHDGDGKADHTAEEHTDDTTDATADTTDTATDTTDAAADTTDAVADTTEAVAE